jgi:hypothetical protein
MILLEVIMLDWVPLGSHSYTCSSTWVYLDCYNFDGENACEVANNFQTFWIVELQLSCIDLAHFACHIFCDLDCYLLKPL